MIEPQPAIVRIDQATAQDIARRTLKRVQVGETGYIYAMSTRGDTSMVTKAEVEHVLKGGSARIVR